MADPQILSIRGPWRGKVTALPLDEQPQGTVLDSRDVWPFDAKTGRARLAVRAGYSAAGSGPTAGLFTLGNAAAEPGSVQLMGASSTTLYAYRSGSFGSVGTITTSASRTIHAVGYGKKLYIACNAPYKVYDYDPDNNGNPSDESIADWTASPGTIPPNCHIVALHGARIVLMADPANPNVVNFSRTDAPRDWDTSASDNGAAISLPIGEAGTAGIPHNKDCFVVGTKSGMWVVRGNPGASNGSVEQFDFTVGPINSSAWCKGDKGYTYLLTHNGLYRMAPGCGTAAEPVSRHPIPDALIGLDGTNSKAYLVYDERFKLVQIHIMGTNAASWCFDTDGGGFWPITAPGTGILAAHRFGPLDSATASGSLVATGNNGVMRFDNATALGGASAAYATFLTNLAPAGQKSLIPKAIAHWGSNTDDSTGTVTIFGAENATNAAAQTADRKSAPYAIGTLPSANHGVWFPRVGGHSASIKIAQTDTSKHWSLEALDLYLTPNGTERG